MSKSVSHAVSTLDLSLYHIFQPYDMPLIIHVFYENLKFFEFWIFFNKIWNFFTNFEILWKFWKKFEILKFLKFFIFWNLSTIFFFFKLKIFEILWNFEIFWAYDIGYIRYRVCDIGYTRYRLGTIIDNAYAKHLYFNLNIWYISIQVTHKVIKSGSNHQSTKVITINTN